MENVDLSFDQIDDIIDQPLLFRSFAVRISDLSRGYNSVILFFRFSGFRYSQMLCAWHKPRYRRSIQLLWSTCLSFGRSISPLNLHFMKCFRNGWRQYSKFLAISEETRVCAGRVTLLVPDANPRIKSWTIFPQ